MKKILFACALAGLSVTGAFAQDAAPEPMMYATSGNMTTPTKYPDSASLLKAEGGMCQAATDGCNAFTIDNGQLGASTMMYCFAPSDGWSCTKYAGQPSLDDQAKYANLRATADTAVLRAVDAFVLRFRGITLSLSAADTATVKNVILSRVDAKMNEMLGRAPQEIVVAGQAWQALELVRLELGKMQ